MPVVCQPKEPAVDFGAEVGLIVGGAVRIEPLEVLAYVAVLAIMAETVESGLASRFNIRAT